MSLYESLLEKLNGHEYSGYFSANCQFHNDAHPSMFVYEDGGFRCASCGKHGSLKYLAQKVGSHFSPVRNNTVSNILPQWQKWGDSLDDIATKAHQNLVRYPQFQGYLKRRKCEGFIEKGYLGYNNGWIVVPVFSADGKLADIVARAVKGKGDSRYVLKPLKNAPRPLYVPNWGILQESEQIYVVFGIFDAIGMSLMGFPVVTGITGKSIDPELIASLHKRVVIIPDAGEERDAHRLANSLGWRARVKEIEYPFGTKDIAEIRELNRGEEYLKEILQ